MPSPRPSHPHPTVVAFAAFAREHGPRMKADLTRDLGRPPTRLECAARYATVFEKATRTETSTARVRALAMRLYSVRRV